MAEAFKNAVISGRQSFLSGRINKTIMGSPSSPKKELFSFFCKNFFIIFF